MARLTREQAQKWSAQAANGFTFDIEWFLTWNEKQLIKSIKQDNGEIIQFKIRFRKESERVQGRYCAYTRETGRVIPEMDIYRLLPLESGCYRVLTIKSGVTLGEPQEKRAYKTLCECSKDIDTAEWLERLEADKAA
jgi:hypothetical protein